MDNREGAISGCILRWMNRFLQCSNAVFNDNALIELSLSLPDNLRARSYIYKKTLLHNYPEFFREFHGKNPAYRFPIRNMPRKSFLSANAPQAESSVKRKALDCPCMTAVILQVSVEKTIGEPGLSFFNKLFTNKNAYYPAYLDRAKVLKTWDLHKSGKRRHRHDKPLRDNRNLASTSFFKYLQATAG